MRPRSPQLSRFDSRNPVGNDNDGAQFILCLGSRADLALHTLMTAGQAGGCSRFVATAIEDGSAPIPGRIADIGFFPCGENSPHLLSRARVLHDGSMTVTAIKEAA